MVPVDAVDCAALLIVVALAPVANDDGLYPCERDGAGTLFASVSFDCDDGRMLDQMDEAWWIESKLVMAPTDNTFGNIAAVRGNV